MLLLACTTVAGAASLSYLALRLWCPWLVDDFRFFSRIFPPTITYMKWLKKKHFMIDIFEAHVVANPNKTLLLFEDKKFTYKEINEQANRIAKAGLSVGLKNGDVVAVMIQNCPAFIWTFIGFMKIGVTTALINTNLRGKSLVHCISVSEAQSVIVGEGIDLEKAIEEILPELPEVTVYFQGPADHPVPHRFKSFHELTNSFSADPIDKTQRPSIEATDILAYIYTSGTTGLPKAARVSQRKSLMAYVVTTTAGLTKDDILYSAMPLYHSSALLVGFTSCAIQGSTFAFSRKFSKSNFFKDCKKHGATIMLYIGELCRYLLTNPVSEEDKDHCLRIAIGNGLRQDIFQDFKERFGIQHIVEFYAATEGAAGFINVTDTIGACGRLSPVTQKVSPLELFRYDVDNEDLIRDDKGHCIPVKRGTPGLLLMKLNKLQVFEGYQGKKELSESKIVRNVLTDGDSYFNSGDMMVQDERYNIYFNDRVGDTFRWKGENVSTTEVSNMLTEPDFIVDACVYGVAVSGQADGKAGMATILIAESQKSFDERARDEFLRHCQQSLPIYARPIFLRVKKEELELTSTIKQNKINLRKEGFDISVVKDDLFYFDRAEGKYLALTKDAYEKILKNEINF